MQHRCLRGRVAAASLGIALVLSGIPAAPALAATSDELEAQVADAQSQLDWLAMQAAALGEQLGDTEYQLEQTAAQISQTEQDIEQTQLSYDDAQQQLAARMQTNYKQGATSLLDMVLGSASFEELVTNIHYATKIYEDDQRAIAQVQSLKDELEGQKAELEQQQASQEQLLEDQKSQQASYESQQAEQQAYVDGLSQELKDAIAAEEEAARKAAEEAAKKAAEEAAQKAAEEAARKEAEERAAAEAQQNASTSSSAGNSESGSSAATTGSGSSSGSSGSSGSSSSSSAGSSSSASANSSSTVSKIVAGAYSQLGVGYVFGAYSPGSALDCSGLTAYAYSCAGISIPHSSIAQYNGGTKVSRSELSAGDLIYWSSVAGSGSGRHVALYVGNGLVVHANGRRVVEQELSEVTQSNWWGTPTGYCRYY